MAVNSNDPTTGRPIFVDTDAPDIKVDPTEAAKYAADVGNRIVRANLAALEAYAYKREGLSGYAADSGVEYVHDGTGWVLSGGTTPWVTVTAFGTGWASTPGYTVQVRRTGSLVLVRGAVTVGTAASAANLFTVPAGFEPDAATWFPQTNSSGTFTGSMRVSPSGLVDAPNSYYDGTISIGTVIPIAGVWYVD